MKFQDAPMKVMFEWDGLIWWKRDGIGAICSSGKSRVFHIDDIITNVSDPCDLYNCSVAQAIDALSPD